MIDRILIVSFVVSLACSPARADISYVRQVQPILARNCFACHGPDDKKREAELRLDVRKSALESGAIAAGKPDESELLRRVVSNDPDERMPPPEHGKPLSAAQIDVLRKWIEQGAPMEKHWAFVRPVRSPLPKVSNRDYRNWPTTAIDYFVLERLEANHKQPSAAAERYTIVRRVYLDLLGRGPTPEEADRFVNDQGARAYEQMVDRLLASPQYGERWARPWLDLARYSDTNGYEKDRERSIWPYRDWIIRALNADMPYHQFSIEQLAGDMLPGATSAQRVATGFHRNTMLNEEGGIDPLEFRYYAMVDRVATTGLVWLGLTTGCAQCHTHKYDPITHTDYYAMMALLNNADEPDRLVRDEATIRRRAEMETEIAALESRLPDQFPVETDNTADPQSRRAQMNLKFNEWVTQQSKSAGVWKVIRPERFSTNLPRLEVLSDGSLFSTGDITKRDVFTLEFDLSKIADVDSIRGLRLEVMPDDRLPAGGPGRAFYEGRKGDFFLSELDAEIVIADEASPIAFDSPSHSYGKLSIGSGSADAANVLDNEGSTGWSTSGREGSDHQLVLPTKEPLPAKGILKVTLLFERHFAASLGRFRFSIADGGAENQPSNPGAVLKASKLPVEVEAILAKPQAEWTKHERDAALTHFLRSTPLLAEQRKKIDELKAALPKFTPTMVMLERPPDNPRPTHRHHRGEYLSPREAVSAAIPQFLQAENGEAPSPTNRLEFAQWLVSRDNPLAARVAVNRAWRHFWGHGLVRTSGDFGTQSEPPTHPELLDYLAIEWMAHDWSLKWLHREIVTSAAYRQQSAAPRQDFAVDPSNRLLARGPRLRVEAEVLRDSVLAGADLLTTKLGGRSVFPPQPKSVVQLAYGNVAWNESQGADRYRRSLYTYSKRTAPFAAYSVFDGPSGETCLARRNRSNTPLQSLTLLNDPMFLEAAKALGRQATQLDGDHQVRATFIFRRLLTRPPTADEQSALVTYFQRQMERLSNGELNAEQVGGKGASAEAAAWGMVARVVMNLDEAIAKQ